MRRAIFLCVPIVAAACGGAVTTVDGNDNTGSLTPTDQNQLCVDTFNYVKNDFSTTDLAKLECGNQESANGNTQVCNDTYNSCVTKAEAQLALENPLATATPDCTGFNEQVAKCNTTVGEYAKCFKEEIDFVKNLEGKFPLCSQSSAQAAEIIGLQSLSEDCVNLLTSCQLTFAPSGGSGGSGGGTPDAGPPDGG